MIDSAVRHGSKIDMRAADAVETDGRLQNRAERRAAVRCTAVGVRSENVRDGHAFKSSFPLTVDRFTGDFGADAVIRLFCQQDSVPR